MKWSAMDIWSSSIQGEKNSEDKIFLAQSFKELNEFITELKSNIHHNSIIETRLDHPCPSHSALGGGNHKKLITTSHDAIVIKPTSQEHNYPEMDNPCPSVLTQLL
jgi:hypothetical protein